MVPRAMTAAFLTGRARLALRETPIPSIGLDEALIKVRAVGLCGSDARVYRQGSPQFPYPGIPGHEISGDIVLVGTQVRRWRVGDRVAVGSLVPCGRCSPCLTGAENICEKSEKIGYQRRGGLAEYLALPSDLLTRGHIARIPPNVTYDVASLTEPLAAVLSAFERMGGITGRSLAVLGSGGAAGLAVLAAHILGAASVVLCGSGAARYRPAITRRARVIPYRTPSQVEAALRRAAPNGSFDRVFVASDRPEFVSLAAALLGIRGIAVLFGVTPRGKRTPINTNDLHYREASLIGTFSATRIVFGDALRLLAQKPREFGELLTHRFPLSNVQDAYNALSSRRRTKIVIHPSEEKGAI